MSGRKYAEAQAALEAYRRLWERLRHVPGVVAAGGMSALPLSGAMAWGPITVEGRAAGSRRGVRQRRHPDRRRQLLRGDADPARSRAAVHRARTRATTPRAIVIDEQMARQLWPDQDPIGKRVRTGGMDASADAPWMTVVGVVGRVKQDGLDTEPRMAMHWAHSQVPTRTMTVVLRTAGGPGVGGSGRARRDSRRSIRICRSTTSQTMASASGRVAGAARRFSMLLLTLFASLALGLSSDRHLWRHCRSGLTAHAGAGHPDGARCDAARDPGAWSCGRD